MKIFSVYDSKAEAYLQPIFCKTTAVAVRMFEAAAADAGHDFGKFSGDYTLFELGEWDEQVGEFAVYGAQVNLGTALSFQRSE